MTDPKQILETSKTILLVDWPNTTVPRGLLESGFIVFGCSPNHYSKAEIVTDLPTDVESISVFPPKNENEKGYLIFRRLDKRPPGVDIVSIYRPASELQGIITDHALPLDAKVVWLQRPATSSEEQSMVEKHNLVFIENNDIVATARNLAKA
jgi:predicted CoA-binding protein